MDKSEIRRIVAFLKDVQEGLYEGDEVVTMQLQLTELLRVIKRLMDATSATKNQDLRLGVAGNFRVLSDAAPLKGVLVNRSRNRSDHNRVC